MYEFLDAREQEFRKIVAHLSLPDFVSALPYQLLGNAYHNSHHLRSVAINAYHIAKSEGCENDIAMIAFLAGISHDMGYINPAHEAANIIVAQRHFSTLCQQLYILHPLEEVGQAMIRNTINDGKPKDFTAGKSDDWIVYDSDLSVWFNIEQDEMQYLLEGLSKEMNITATVESTKDFLSHAGFGTITGQKKLEEFLQSDIELPSVDFMLGIA